MEFQKFSLLLFEAYKYIYFLSFVRAEGGNVIYKNQM